MYSGGDQFRFAASKPGARYGLDYRALADFRYEIRRFLNFSEIAARSARPTFPARTRIGNPRRSRTRPTWDPKEPVMTPRSQSSAPLTPSSSPTAAAPAQSAGYRIGYISLLAAALGILAGFIAYILYDLIGLFANLA